MSALKAKKIIIGITAPQSVDLLRGQLRYLSLQGFDVALLAPKHERVITFCKNEDIRLIPVEIERNISPIMDLLSLLRLIQILRREKPDILNLGTPKISLIGLVAGWITRVPYRIYTCRGLRFEREKGKLRFLLKILEKVSAKSSHRVFCISPSLADLGVNEKIFTRKKVRLIHKGSSNGVNLNLFSRININLENQSKLKKDLQLDSKFVFGFVGRLSDVKGLHNMYDAFNQIYSHNKDIVLLIIGRPFWDLISDKNIITKLNDHPGVIMMGYQSLETIPTYMSLMDCFLMLSKGEGFGNVYIEAAAMGIPIIATDVTGVKDAVSNGFNGVLVKEGNQKLLIESMLRIKKDDLFRKELGENGLNWSQNFEPNIIWNGYMDLYKEPLDL